MTLQSYKKYSTPTQFDKKISESDLYFKMSVIRCRMIDLRSIRI